MGSNFKYHPKCKRIQLTHLMFADDLLMFAKADQGSVVELFKAFHKFSRASGLEANNDKSCIYVTGISHDSATHLATLMNMPIGELPFIYLGVPLAAKKLSFTQCKPLIDRITDRAQGWMAHFLTYAGRLQLIKAILGSMQNFSAQIFPLPKKLTRDVESICRRFLWTGSPDQSKKAPVAWDSLPMPKAAGG